MSLDQPALESADMGGGSDLSPLSCVGCRNRKIRCNRKKPTCSRCINRNLTCHYPKRAKRPTAPPDNQQHGDQPGKPSLPGRATTTQLNITFERLLDIEGNTNDGRSSNRHPQTITASTSTPAGGEHNLRRWRAASPGQEAIPDHSPNTPDSTLNLAYASPRSDVLSQTSSRTDAINFLKAALDHVQTLRVQTISRLSLKEPLRLPLDVAKSWVETFFEVQPVDMFLGFIDTKLIKLVPDIIDMPDVTLRPVVHVLYFSLLHYGASMPVHYAFQDKSREVDYPTLTYVGALRALPAWQREATGTKTDFAAAILMALTASENFDFDMAWQMFQLASKYAEKLQLHTLDTNPTQADGGAMDDERRSLWDLIGKDLFCRLLYDRPPILSGDLSSWRVNLPWLGITNSLGPSRSVPDVLTMIFLVRSRLTFTLNEYFQVMETGNPRVIVDTTHKLCRELVQVYDEWPITQCLNDTSQQEGTWWRICEVCLDGYSSIIMMLCKTNRIDTGPSPTGSSSISLLPTCPIDEHGPLSHLMIDVSRRLLALAGNFLAVFPVLPTVSLIFGLYRCYYPIGNLARRIYADSGDPNSMEDARIIDKISVGVDRAARNHKDLRSLVLAMRDISRSVRVRLGHDVE